MKLLRLKLNSDFRSLGEGFDLHFLREGNWDLSSEFNPYCLAGRNGSGKSNILEVLAAIFYHIECIHLDSDSRPADFMSEDEDDLSLPGFNPRLCEPDAFELEYLIQTEDFLNLMPGSELSDRKPIYRVRLEKLPQTRPTISVAVPSCSEWNTGIELQKEEVKKVLPAYVIGYSSGHNEVLSLPFFKMRFVAFDEYHDKLIKQLSYPEHPKSRLIYLDDQFSQVILICHYLFPNCAAIDVFRKIVGLDGFRCFRLIIRRFNRVELDQAISRAISPKVPENPTIELTSSLSRTIDKLICCSTTRYELPRDDESEDAVDLYLDYWLDDATQEAFRYHFRNELGGTKEEQNAASALNLFHAFRMLLTLNLYRVKPETKRELYESASLYVNETIPTPASDERIARFKDSRLIKPGLTERIYLKNLSDGEHQFLHTVGLCALFRYEQALFLLDEPETHLNPDWRASYVSTLRDALETDEVTKDVMREVLITSHSPFVISDCREENVIVFEKNKNGKVECKPPGFRTFGASANAITMKIFGQKETIGDFAMGEIKKLRVMLNQNKDPDDLISEANELLGDSVEKILFINEALNRKEGK